MKLRFFTILLICLATLNFFGCATQPYVLKPPERIRTGGIYHKVMPGETLWRISKLYNVDLDEIVSVNKLPNAAKIERGQMIFIPGAVSEMRIELAKASPTDTNFAWPIDGKVITYFGERFNDRLSKGLNIQFRDKKDVLASRSGRVSFADFLKGYGKTVIIEHPDGLSTVYAYNSQIFVKPKDSVNQGMVIGRCDTQDSSYLHFEVRRGSRPQNPLHYLP